MKLTIACICLATLCLPACTTTESQIQPDIITIEGRVSQRGNTPFQAWMAETDNRNSYILKLEGENHQYSSSRRYRITGRLYKDQWNGRDYAHLEVISIEDLRQ